MFLVSSVRDDHKRQQQFKIISFIFQINNFTEHNNNYFFKTFPKLISLVFFYIIIIGYYLILNTNWRSRRRTGCSLVNEWVSCTTIKIEWTFEEIVYRMKSEILKYVSCVCVDCIERQDYVVLFVGNWSFELELVCVCVWLRLEI